MMALCVQLLHIDVAVVMEMPYPIAVIHVFMQMCIIEPKTSVLHTKLVSCTKLMFNRLENWRIKRLFRISTWNE